MSLEENKAVARRWHADLYKAGRVEVADEICSPDLRMHGTGVPSDVAAGTAFVKEDVAAYRGAFSFDYLNDDDVIAEGDKVAIRWTFKGTNNGPMGDIPATGKQVEVTGIDIFRIEDGRIAEFWTELNMMSLMEQIGPLPAGANA